MTLTVLCLSRRDAGLYGLLDEITNSAEEGKSRSRVHDRSAVIVRCVTPLCFSAQVPVGQLGLSAGSAQMGVFISRLSVSSSDCEYEPSCVTSASPYTYKHSVCVCFYQLSSDEMVAEFSQMLDWCVIFLSSTLRSSMSFISDLIYVVTSVWSSY